MYNNAYGSTRSDISSAQRSGFHPISSTWKLDGLCDLRRPELQVSSDRRSVAQRGMEWCHAKNCMSWYNLIQFKQLLRCNMLQHVGSAGGVCPAWNKVDCDYMWWVSAAVCCSCSHGVDFTVFFHIKCGCSQVDFISCFQMQLIIECFDNVQTWVFFAKSGGKINNHL